MRPARARRCWRGRAASSAHWKRPALLVALAFNFGACGWGSSWKLGSHKNGEMVDASGAGIEEAKRSAVESQLDLFVSSAARASAAAELERGVLSHPDSYITRHRLEGDEGGPSGSLVRLRALVDLGKVGADIGRLGLFGGPAAGPRIRIEMESPGPEAGDAAGALRQILLERGFSVQEGGASPAGGEEIIVKGRADVFPVSDPRLEKFPAYRARVSVEISTPALANSGPSIAQATAVDLSTAGAAAKALRNAGELAGQRAAEILGVLYGGRMEYSVVVIGLENLSEARRLLERVRELPSVSGASFARHIPGLPPETRLRVRASIGSDALAAALLSLRGYSFRALAVEPDYVELETAVGGG